MSYEQVLIGFDTRVSPEEAASRWADPERRDQYLLQPDVSVPLSVDEAVWPRRGSALDEGRLEVRTPRFATRAEAEAAREPGDVVVAITAWQGPGLPAAHGAPAAPEADWELLGWDVVADVFPSAVSNCGFLPDDVLAWRGRWEGRFNRWHLFDDLPSAFAYRDASDRRVEEHAPFSVLGLWRVGGPASPNVAKP